MCSRAREGTTNKSSARLARNYRTGSLRRRVNEPRDGLFEDHAHPGSLAPHDAAGPMRSVAWHDQRERLRDPDLADHFQRRAVVREGANRAIDLTPAEVDRPGFQDPLAWVVSHFGHHTGSALLGTRLGEINPAG